MARIALSSSSRDCNSEPFVAKRCRDEIGYCALIVDDENADHVLRAVRGCCHGNATVQRGADPTGSQRPAMQGLMIAINELGVDTGSFGFAAGLWLR